MHKMSVKLTAYKQKRKKIKHKFKELQALMKSPSTLNIHEMKSRSCRHTSTIEESLQEHSRTDMKEAND